MKKLILLFLCALLMLSLISCDSSSTTTSGSSTKSQNDEKSFYELVVTTQDLLDSYADDIYSCWYDYVYEDEYSSVDSAILSAMLLNSDNIETIESNNESIKELYKKAKEGDLSAELKDVMQAYNDYYALVMEVSGSFTSFSQNKETLKKELSSALKNLEFELD